jgi:hypothetical protein
VLVLLAAFRNLSDVSSALDRDWRVFNGVRRGGHRYEGKPTATAARFDEPKPAATNSKAKANSTAKSKAPA